jgi:hypothetical protein
VSDAFAGKRMLKNTSLLATEAKSNFIFIAPIAAFIPMHTSAGIK